MTGMAINAQVPDIDSAAIIINESGNFDPKATLRAEDRRFIILGLAHFGMF
jgi:hypothetical protein